MIKEIIKIWDDVWAWTVWSLIKWPFGILVCWFVIFLIWSMEVNHNFDKELMGSVGKSIHQIGQEVRSYLSNISLESSSPIKNIK